MPLNKGLLEVGRGFRDSNIEYLSGTVAPSAASGDLLARILNAPKGSFYTNATLGESYKKKGSAGTIADYVKLLDEGD